MITKISKLKDFGIFHDFSWKKELPDFSKYNLIYGWNRSGKTTVSRIFASCEKKCTYDEDRFKQYPVTFNGSTNQQIEGQFEIRVDDNKIVKNTNVTSNVLPIKVFNQDFIDENISFDSSDSCNAIVYVSQEDIETKEKLKLLNDQRKPLSANYQKLKESREGTQKIEDNFRISLAQTIKQLLTDLKKRDRYYSYDKRSIKEKINEIGVHNFSDKVLPDDDKKKHETTSKSEAKVIQTKLPKYQFSFSFNGKTINNFQKIFEEVEGLLSKKVISETLNRLKDDLNLNNWVKQGFDLHKIKKEKEKCLFCQKPLDNDFLAGLSKHFSKNYEKLLSTIIRLKEKILTIKNIEHAVKNDELYQDLKNNYSNKVKELNKYVKRINLWIDEAVKKLEEKHDNPLVVVANTAEPEDFLTSYNEIIAELNKIIDEHNSRSKNHINEVADARSKLELHLIATALAGQDYKKMVGEISEASKKENDALDAINKNNSDIEKLEKQTSNISTAITEINKYLKDFFGREEIKLELDRPKKGYTIKRFGKLAKNLSESEKTAIAFSYFIVKVRENDFDKTSGIIFIDDPISSFDSNFIYHCFSLIKTYFEEVGQLFISTHNFQLFNLAKEWFIGKNTSTRKKNQKRKSGNITEKLIPCKFFMIESFTESNVRKAKIGELDKTLRDYKSEYHFLFVKLNDFAKEENAEYADFYIIGNIARRFFDIFADFKIPKKVDQRSKMESLIKDINHQNELISIVDYNKANQLINEFSHNSDPTSTIEHKNKSEIKDAIKILLDIVEKSDPQHFKYLREN